MTAGNMPLTCYKVANDMLTLVNRTRHSIHVLAQGPDPMDASDITGTVEHLMSELSVFDCDVRRIKDSLRINAGSLDHAHNGKMVDSRQGLQTVMNPYY